MRALDHITLDIRVGQFFCLMGPSGSGKSTLLHLVAGIDRPTDGTVEVLGSAIGQMDDRSLARWRSQNIGYIFQSFNLVPVMTAAENVELPLLLTHLSKKERRERAHSALEIVGLNAQRIFEQALDLVDEHCALCAVDYAVIG